MSTPVFVFSSSGMPGLHHHEFNSCTEAEAVFHRIGELGLEVDSAVLLGSLVRCIAYHEYVDASALAERAGLHILWACLSSELSPEQRSEIEAAWIETCRNEPDPVTHAFLDTTRGGH